MTELLRNAWTGWTEYTEAGKLAALLLAVLLFLWFGRRWKEQGALVLYTSVMTVCCIVPLSAVVLMLYQTKFYDYEWIWSMVPLTTVIAYGIALFWTEYCGEYKGGRWRKSLPLTALLLAAVLLCGNMGIQSRENRGQKAEKERATTVLEALAEKRPEGEGCLWAPREILEYARETDASLKLLYGRNMWDYALNAYAYDSYDERTGLLYRWMTQVEENGEADLKAEGTQAAVSLEEIAGYALDAGVTLVLFPETVESETIKRMEKALGAEVHTLEGYYLLTL